MFRVINKLYSIDKKALDILVFLICCIGTGVWAVTLGQDVNWDLKNYHFYNPYSFLNSKLTYDYAPAMLQSYHSPLLDFPVYWLIKTFPPVLVGFILGFVQGLNTFILYCIAKKVTSQYPVYYKEALVCAMCALGFYSVANICEIGTTFGDNLASILVLYPVLLFTNNYFNNIEEKATGMKFRTLAIAGICMGCGVAMKLPVAVFPIATGVALLWLSSGIQNYMRNAVILGLSVFTGFVLSISYWCLILWENFRNPMFPYFNKFFQSPYFGLINFSDKRFLPDDIWQTLFYPFYFVKWQNYVSEIHFQDIHYAICYVLLVLFGVYVSYKKYIQKKSPGENIPYFPFYLFILTLFTLSYFFWQNLFSIYRYIVVLEFLSPVFIISILSSIIKRKQVISLLFILITFITIRQLRGMDFGRLPWADSYFGVELPKVPDLKKTNIVLGSQEPLAYMIPYFPLTTRFLRVEGNFTSLDDTTLFQKEIKQQLDSNEENYLLLSYMQKGSIEKFEDKFNLNVDFSDCDYFKTRLDDSLCVCRLLRTDQLPALK